MVSYWCCSTFITPNGELLVLQCSQNTEWWAFSVAVLSTHRIVSYWCCSALITPCGELLLLQCSQHTELWAICVAVLSQLDSEYRHINEQAATLTWRLAVDPSSVHPRLIAEAAERRTAWRNAWCYRGRALAQWAPRQMYLLCRGPKYTPHQARWGSSQLAAVPVTRCTIAVHARM